MFRLIAVTCLLLSLASPASCLAQAKIEESSKKPKQLIAFQMLDWTTKHFDTAQEASAHAKILADVLKCEVKTAQHNGHIDVNCRTIVWKSVSCETDDQARQWRTWLDAAGFETLYGHIPTEKPSSPAGTPVKEIVKYRLAEWKSQHAHKAIELNQFTAIYSGLGCETEQVDHGNHKDLRIRCVEWMEVELPSHVAAHKWQDFLNKAGFETTHEH